MKNVLVLILSVLVGGGVSLAALAQSAEVPVNGSQAIVWAVGDICDDDNEVEDCADIGEIIAADRETDAVLGLGDMQYEKGSLAHFNQYYDPKMGRGASLYDRTLPAVGNHEYGTAGAAGYFDYWGVRAGERNKGYYDASIGGWNVIATNSNCSKVGGCTLSSPQGVWLNAALEKAGKCEIVFDHHPAFSDGTHGDSSAGKALFRNTYNNYGDLFLSGHDHNYQRFAPRRPDGTVTLKRGVTQLVSGAGGKSLYGFTSANRTAYRQNTHDGALRLHLKSDGWTAQFLNTDGEVMDQSTGQCR